MLKKASDKWRRDAYAEEAEDDDAIMLLECFGVGCDGWVIGRIIRLLGILPG